jgi:predicted amidohydrolase
MVTTRIVTSRLKREYGNTMKVGLGQIACMPADVEANVRSLTSAVQRAADEGCSVVVLPEVADVGYAMSRMSEVAGSWDGGAFGAMCEIARSTGLHVICGLTERDGPHVFNSLAAINPEGRLAAKYRKIHLIDAGAFQESRRFQAGEDLVTVSIGGLTWGLMICYDLRFAELARALMHRGADILVYSSAWPKSRITHWQTMTRGRAVESQVYVLGANRTGTEEDIVFGGCSVAVDPHGAVLDEADGDEETLVTAEITKSRIEEVRGEVPVRSALRHDLYARFAQQQRDN